MFKFDHSLISNLCDREKKGTVDIAVTNDNVNSYCSSGNFYKEECIHDSLDKERASSFISLEKFNENIKQTYC
ncbi:MAG: hypothetical protein ACXWFC_02990 [Nitrososphaeraceae archaeon]